MVILDVKSYFDRDINTFFFLLVIKFQSCMSSVFLYSEIKRCNLTTRHRLTGSTRALWQEKLVGAWQLEPINGILLECQIMGSE